MSSLYKEPMFWVIPEQGAYSTSLIIGIDDGGARSKVCKGAMSRKMIIMEQGAKKKKGKVALNGQEFQKYEKGALKKRRHPGARIKSLKGAKGIKNGKKQGKLLKRSKGWRIERTGSEEDICE